MHQQLFARYDVIYLDRVMQTIEWVMMKYMVILVRHWIIFYMAFRILHGLAYDFHISRFTCWFNTYVIQRNAVPDSKVHGAYMGPTWGRQDPVGPHVGWPHELCYQGCLWLLRTIYFSWCLWVPEAPGLFYWHGITLTPAWMNNHRHSIVWYEFTHPFPNFHDSTVEWINSFISQLITHWGQVTHICVSTLTTLIKKMACRLFGAKSLSEPMMEYRYFEQ